MPSIFEIQLRHAIYYALRLDQINKKYLKGGDEIFSALVILEEEWDNITNGQSWSAQYASINSIAAELTIDYPDAGTQILLLYQHPLERIEWRKTALALSEQKNHIAAIGANLANLGLAYLDLGQLRQAVDYFVPALEKLSFVDDQKGQVIVRINLGNTYLLIGLVEQSLVQFNHALNLSRKINDQRSEGNALLGIGSVQVISRQITEAIETYQQALAIIRLIQNQRAETSLVANIGLAYFELGQIHQAHEWFNQALLMARKIGDQDIEFHSLINIGRVHLNLDEPDQSLTLFSQALLIAKESNNERNRAIALENIGFSFEVLGNLKDAAVKYQEALEICEQIDDRMNLGCVLLNLSSIFLKTGEIKLTITALRQALMLGRSIKDVTIEVNALAIWGVAYQTRNKFQRARACFEQQLELAKKINYARGQGKAYWNLSLLYHAQGNKQKAIEFGNKTLEIYNNLEYAEINAIKSQLDEWLNE